MNQLAQEQKTVKAINAFRPRARGAFDFADLLEGEWLNV